LEIDENLDPKAATTWLPEVKTWIAVRLDKEEFAHLCTPGYSEYLYARVSQLRAMFLTEDEFLKACRGTAWGLIFRTQLFIAGLECNETQSDIVAAMFAVLPEYPSFYSFQDALIGSVPMRDLAKMQMLEGEMFSVVIRYLSQDANWFEKTMTDTQALAVKYWDDKQQPSGSLSRSQAADPQPASSQAIDRPIRMGLAGLIGHAFLAVVGVIWLWNCRFYWPGAEAVGQDLVTVGLPLLLLYYAARRLYKQLVARAMVTPYKLVFGLLSIPAAVLSVLDFLNPVAPHRLGALLLTLSFSIAAFILFALAYQQQRNSKVDQN